MKYSAQILSLLFHPLLMLLYVLLLLLALDPYEFTLQGNGARVSFFVYTIVIGLIIPILSMFIMKMLGMIQSLEMKSNKERIGPLIVVGTLYLWLFINLKDQTGIPEVLISFVLGLVLAVFGAFFFNNFTKLSLHMVGLGGTILFFFVLKTELDHDLILVSFFQYAFVAVTLDVLIMLTILLTGLVASARLWLGSHNRMQLLEGFIIGALAQLVAFRIIL